MCGIRKKHGKKLKRQTFLEISVVFFCWVFLFCCGNSMHSLGQATSNKHFAKEEKMMLLWHETFRFKRL